MDNASALGWVADIEEVTLDNATFRTVLYTGAHAQLTVMRLAPGEEIGWEAHDHLDQFIRLEQGRARVDDVKLYSLYTPPEHPAGTVHRSKPDAEAAEASH